MSEGFVSRKAKEAQLYPKSSGESANNENQIITPFKWENNADKTKVIVSLKDKYVFNISDLTTLLSSSAITSLLYRPPIGIPVFWFSPVPDWALAFDDGSGPYDWADYPELDNEDFKAMLTIWSTAGWMSAHTSTQFYVPDLRGINPIISGTNGLIQVQNVNGVNTGVYYSGGALGEITRDAIRNIAGNLFMHGAGKATVLASASGVFSPTAIRSYYRSGGSNNSGAHSCDGADFSAGNVVPVGSWNRVVTFGLHLIVRFE